MYRSALALAVALGVASPVAHAQLAAVSGAVVPNASTNPNFNGLIGGQNFTQGFNANQISPQFFQNFLNNAAQQQAGANNANLVANANTSANGVNGQNQTRPTIANGGFVNINGNNGYGYNNGFGLYQPSFAVGGTGFGLPGLNGPNNYGGFYNNPATYGVYGSNSLSSLLRTRTIGNLSYFGPPSTLPGGIENLNDLNAVGLMPVGAGSGGNFAIQGPKTKPGQGVVGSTAGNSEASAILNGALPNRVNPRSAGKVRGRAKRGR